MNWALSQKTGSHAAKSVLLILANRANQDGICWPGLTGIAEQTELSRRSVITQIKKLIECGCISVESRGHQSNIYALNMGSEPDSLVKDVHHTSEGRSPAVVNHVHLGSEPRSPEPSITQNKPKSNPKRSSDRFEDFWSVYPKKVKKVDSLKKWKLKNLDAIADTLIADVENRLANDGRWLEGFVPDPTTYLNGERWNDDLEPRRMNKKKTYAEELADGMRDKGMIT